MKTTLLILTLTILILSIQAQHQNITVGERINEYEPNEPCIIVNPSNTDQMFIGTNNTNLYTSEDGGLSWSRSVPETYYSINGDPCLLIMKNYLRGSMFGGLIILYKT